MVDARDPSVGEEQSAVPPRTLRLGILIPGSPNRFFDKVLAGIRSVLLSEVPHQLILAVGEHTRPDDSSSFDELMALDVDALILLGARVPPARVEAAARQRAIVAIGRHDESTNYDTIVGDDEAGARLAMEYLLARGHTDIAHLTHEDVTPGTDQATPHAVRLWVYEQILRERGLAAHGRILRCASGEDSAYGVMRQLLATANRPSAVFAAHDQLALGALNAVAEAGLTRDDVEIVGYDNTTIAGHALISLTTVDQDGEGMGRRAARLVLERLEGRTSPTHVRVEVALVVR